MKFSLYPCRSSNHNFNLDLVNFVAIEIINPLIISKLIKELDTLYPFPPNLRHVKRVRKDPNTLSILLWSEALAGKDNGLVFEQFYLDRTKTFFVQVPKYPPHDKEEWVKRNSVWPVTFHFHIPKYPSWDSFSDEYRAFISNHYQSAVLFNPLSLQVLVQLTSSYAPSCQNTRLPLEHPTMAILKCSSFLLFDKKSSSLPSDSLPKDAYFATGLDLILQDEPCIMCAMALVHSRVRYLFISNVNTLRGGFSSLSTAINMNPQFNHHYGVYLKE